MWKRRGKADHEEFCNPGQILNLKSGFLTFYLKILNLAPEYVLCMQVMRKLWLIVGVIFSRGEISQPEVNEEANSMI